MDDNPFFTLPATRAKIERLETLLSRPVFDLTPGGTVTSPPNPTRDKAIADAAAELRRRIEARRGQARGNFRGAAR